MKGLCDRVTGGEESCTQQRLCHSIFDGQGVVTYILPIEVIDCDQDHNFLNQKCA